MKQFILSLSTFALIVASIFVFASCEKEENTNSNQNIVKCLEEDDLDDIFYSFPDNPNVLISVSNERTYTKTILLSDAYGKGTITRDKDNKVTGITCVEGGNNCGRAFLLSDDGNPEREGIYVHDLDDQGRPIATYYDWNQIYRE